MIDSTKTRQQAVAKIAGLSENSLLKLMEFIDYLQYKEDHQSVEPSTREPAKNFLLSIAGLGSSGETDISERDEEILAREVHPIYGWKADGEEQV